MAYVDYEFYEETYSAGSPMVSKDRFPFYENQAEAIIREMTLDHAASYTGGDEVKMATCAVVDQLFQVNGESDSAEGKAPVNVASEKVGEYSVSYKGNSYSELQTEALKTARAAARVWLAPTGLLFKGI